MEGVAVVLGAPRLIVAEWFRERHHSVMSAIDDALDWGRGLAKTRDLLRDGLSVALIQVDPDSPEFAELADLYCLTDPDEDHAAELEELHRAMVAGAP